ncbi:phosphotransferase family protein [Streptomyces sp. NBC_01304]|uniref:phosphotransferase family protein n=1 Tax=Streptomyces sp. NBC_01304 TaxID=2903818 RepID=UPI002E124855|nr:aminoglycoside phosphotransferase family protein [Streptomyces sp. NBC_01304]
MTRGHHNRNFLVPLTVQMAPHVGRSPGVPVLVRERRRDALSVVIRTWPVEADILTALDGVLPYVPECLARRDGSAVHSYVEGVPLSAICPDGKPVDPLQVKALAGLLAELTTVRRDDLPRLPDGWPRVGRDPRAFLRTLAGAAEQKIRQPNWPAFGGLFAALGIPEDAMRRLAERVPAMTRRPYSLLHTDLHRDNVIVSYGGDPPLVGVDWEFAGYGDPLHDLATHLVRMQYPLDQWDEVIEAWATAVEAVRPEAVAGLSRDLRHYVDFERAQSVYPDVIRAADSLGSSLDPTRLTAGVEAVRRALAAAAEPLRLTRIPDTEEIERILFRRQAALLAARGRDPWVPTIGWEPDVRMRQHAGFSDDAVLEALLAEGAAPADRVLKGTAHLNTVVRVDGFTEPAVVRREIKAEGRRERSFLSEHKVLGAIHESEAKVRAPRVLALGSSHPPDGYRPTGSSLREPFALHSYEGPSWESDASAGHGGGFRPPNHPVHGLLPHEADDLVDQLHELIKVDFEELDPAARQLDFYSWLSGEVSRLVSDLPKESKEMARVLGLPDGTRLQEILARHQVVKRQATLLHGDLNPWNLVRRSDGLTLIDWEMAMVGDPLYDLVRHMHLTPTRPEIRARMFARWSRNLPEVYTTGWRDDQRVYRWIEIVRSAYVDLDRLVTGSLDAPNVQRAVARYAMTLADATASLGLTRRPTANPLLALALPQGERRPT